MQLSRFHTHILRFNWGEKLQYFRPTHSTCHHLHIKQIFRTQSISAFHHSDIHLRKSHRSISTIPFPHEIFSRILPPHLQLRLFSSSHVNLIAQAACFLGNCPSQKKFDITSTETRASHSVLLIRLDSVCFPGIEARHNLIRRRTSYGALSSVSN